MKKIISLLAAVLSGAFLMQVNAQYSPFAGEPDETITNVLIFGAPMNEYAVKNLAAKSMGASVRRSPQQVGAPRFMVSDKSGKAMFAIGGFVNFRMAYDFNNVIGNTDFVTYDIPMSSTPQNAQRFLMDASTSRLYFKTLINTSRGKQVEAYIETDFRGTGNSLRLREAYVSYNGFLAGQTVTTFCDLAASPNTIDFEGPNAYTYGRNMMVRYTKNYPSGFGFGAAIEYPSVSGTPGDKAEIISQRIPDIPVYGQFSWNKNRSHIRASAIMRNMYYLDKVENKTRRTMGWGIQASGALYINKVVSLCGQYLYGDGVANYIQDLQGTGSALVPNMDTPGRLSAPKSTAWLVGVQVNILPKMPMTMAYSSVKLTDDHNYFDATQYKTSQYVVANVFYNFTSWLNVGVEYLYGTRHNQNDAFGASNRIQTAVQVNF